MATSGDILKKRMLAALEKTLGIVTKAADIAGIDRATHYKWLDSDPDYKAAVESIADMALDFAESKLHEMIDGPMKEVLTDEGIQQVKDSPVPSAVIFYLKTKGKKRGYIERTEVSGADGGPIQIIIPQGV
jgi:hypothetical protein